MASLSVKVCTQMSVPEVSEQANHPEELQVEEPRPSASVQLGNPASESRVNTAVVTSEKPVNLDRSPRGRNNLCHRVPVQERLRPVAQRYLAR